MRFATTGEVLQPKNGLLLVSENGASLTMPIRRSSKLRRFAIVILVSSCFCFGAWIERDFLLRGMARIWIVSDTVTGADAAVVLGGGLDVRPFAAADLYRKGLVKKVLISQVADDNLVTIGIVSSHTELNRQVLLRLGVPADAIETFGAANRNTQDEAVALREWVKQNGVSAFIIPTEIFSARRVQFIFRRVLSEQTRRIEVLTLEPPQYTRANWWQTETGLIAFQNEVLKYLYYRFKY